MIFLFSLQRFIIVWVLSLKVYSREFILFLFCEIKRELVSGASGEVLMGTRGAWTQGELVWMLTTEETEVRRRQCKEVVLEL